VFTYSHEENTHAYKLKDDIPQKVKQKRADEIMKIQKEISLKHNKTLIGKTLRVLFDRKEGDYFIGRSEFDSPEVDNEVYLRADKNFVRVGDFSDIKITGAKEYDLEGASAK
jgi:ribosomal protein S12 methylthiotransferase